MAKFLIGTFLMIRLACRQLEIDWALCLELWKNRPVIEVVHEDPAIRKQRLYKRIDTVFPF